MSLEDVYLYFRQYDKETYQVVSCIGNEPSEEDVLAFEKEIGFRLPEDFRQFTMSPLGGMFMEVREELWPRAKAFDVGPFWSFLRGLMVFGIADEIPDFLDIRLKAREMREEGYPELAPFLKLVSDGDSLYCFTSTGEIVLWSWQEPDNPEPIEMTFPELLLKEIGDLEERKNRKLEELKKNSQEN